jgi:hypothetical protein
LLSKLHFPTGAWKKFINTLAVSTV